MIEFITNKTSKKEIIDAAKLGFFDDLENFNTVCEINETLLNDENFIFELLLNATFEHDFEKFEFIYNVFQCVSNQLKHNRKFVEEMLDMNPVIYELLDFELRDDYGLTLLAVKNYGSNLKYTTFRLQDDKNIVFAAIKNDPLSYQYASTNIRDDKDFLIHNIEYYTPFSIKYCTDRLKNDYDVAWTLIHKWSSCIKYMSDEIKDNFDIMFEAVRLHGSNIEYASERLQNDPYLTWYSKYKSLYPM